MGISESSWQLEFLSLKTADLLEQTPLLGYGYIPYGFSAKSNKAKSAKNKEILKAFDKRFLKIPQNFIKKNNPIIYVQDGRPTGFQWSYNPYKWHDIWVNWGYNPYKWSYNPT